MNVKLKVPVSKIIIPDLFRKTNPNSEKVKEKIKFFCESGNQFDSTICVVSSFYNNEDRFYVLYDGYISYLIAKAYGMKYVNVIAEDISISDTNWTK